MTAYKRLYMLVGILVSMPLALIFCSSVTQLNAFGIVLSPVLLVAWWGGYWLLRQDHPLAFRLSLSVVTLLWLPLFTHTIRRIWFTVQIVGMSVDSLSPVLMLFILDQLFFLAVTILLISGSTVLISQRSLSKKKAQLMSENTVEATAE